MTLLLNEKEVTPIPPIPIVQCDGKKVIIWVNCYLFYEIEGKALRQLTIQEFANSLPEFIPFSRELFLRAHVAYSLLVQGYQTGLVHVRLRIPEDVTISLDVSLTPEMQHMLPFSQETLASWLAQFDPQDQQQAHEILLQLWSEYCSDYVPYPAIPQKEGTHE